jgi:hydrogenase/urease accessory protein HupE
MKSILVSRSTPLLRHAFGFMLATALIHLTVIGSVVVRIGERAQAVLRVGGGVMTAAGLAIFVAQL